MPGFISTPDFGLRSPDFDGIRLDTIQAVGAVSGAKIVQCSGRTALRSPAEQAQTDDGNWP